MPSATPPAKSAFRKQVERVSYPPLRWLHSKPRWLVTAILTALMVGGLFAPLPWGFGFLALFVAFILWLTYLAWPESDRGQRTIRVVAIGLAGAALVLRAMS